LLKLTPANHLCGYAGAKLEIRQAFRWVNAISLLEAWRNLRLAAEQLRGLGTLPMQIRFDTS